MTESFEQRIKRLEECLSRVAEGDFQQKIKISERDDALSSLEMGFNFLVMDLRAMFETNQEKEALLLSQQKELESRLARIEEQALTIQELSTPVMEIWDDILVLPIVGIVDTRRSVEIMNTLLSSISSKQAQCILIDLTGVEIVDTRTADYLLKVVRAAGLLGARCVLTGLTPSIAQTLVEIGANLSEVRTLRNLKEGLKDCMAYLKQKELVLQL